jgi:hypothetical protein
MKSRSILTFYKFMSLLASPGVFMIVGVVLEFLGSLEVLVSLKRRMSRVCSWIRQTRKIIDSSVFRPTGRCPRYFAR